MWLVIGGSSNFASRHSLEKISFFNWRSAMPPSAPGNGAIKGKRTSKKDKLPVL